MWRWRQTQREFENWGLAFIERLNLDQTKKNWGSRNSMRPSKHFNSTQSLWPLEKSVHTYMQYVSYQILISSSPVKLFHVKSLIVSLSMTVCFSLGRIFLGAWMVWEIGSQTSFSCSTFLFWSNRHQYCLFQ